MVFNEASSTGVWTLPAGTNLLNGATADPATALTHEGSSASWATLTDGVFAAASPTATPPTAEFSKTVTPNNNTTVTFPLDIAAQPAGYDVTTFDSWCTWANSGRSNQNYTLQYSSVANPTTFITIATVANGDTTTDLSTHTRITDTTGVLATGVHSLRLITGTQENGYVGLTELKATTVPTNIRGLVESNKTNLWPLPGGVNLLNGFTAQPASVSREGSSASWATVTNGLLGTPASAAASVTPGNRTSVVFPLDLSANSQGYKLTSFDSYCAWPNTGRDNQGYTISYSTAADPSTFIYLGDVTAITGGTDADNATHVRLTSATGVLARNVAAVRLDFATQENGYVGYREFIALGSAESLTDGLTWTGNSGSGGNASWITTADNNWKKTSDGTPANFAADAELSFDATAANRNITVPSALSAFSMVVDNTPATPYTFSGQAIALSNSATATGSGDLTFNNSLAAPLGFSFAGSGNLAFNDAVETLALTLSGTGTTSFGSPNGTLAGRVTVSNGSLVVSNNSALENAKLASTGGTTRFLTAAPKVAALIGTVPGSIVLGNPTGPVNTNLSIGDITTTGATTFRGSISEAAGTQGSLTKTTLTYQGLGGTNTYTGPTNVLGGTLDFLTRNALYNGNTAAWTATNLLAGNGGTLSFLTGSADGFTLAEMETLPLGGFQPGSALGINTAVDGSFARALTQPGVGFRKGGTAVLTLTGPLTVASGGATTIAEGAVNAFNPSGASFGGNVVMGDSSGDVYLSFSASNQFGANTVVSFKNGQPFQSKINLRGTSQAVAGLDSDPASSYVPLIQNDEAGTPGYNAAALPGTATLTINAATDHSFSGIIRNQAGGAVSLIKNGPGMQEFRNLYAVQGFGYTGATTINEGTLKLNFASANSGFPSNVAVASGATFQLEGTFNFYRTISGAGKLVKTGGGLISVVNQDGRVNANTFTGGTVIEEGILKFYAQNNSAGEGTTTGEFCVAGPMDPSNIIRVKPGATLGVGGVAPLGNSLMLPQFTPTIIIEPGGKLWGSEGNDLAFVPNINLDGAIVEVMNGGTAGAFNTNMAFVGTVVVGGVSTDPTLVTTLGTGPNANVSLGSLGLPGTVFQVADVTSSSDPDMVIDSVLRNIKDVASPLTKTGPGTLQLIGGKSYTGTTTVTEGVLQLDTDFLADTADVVIAATGTLDLQHESIDTVAHLVLNGVTMDAGIYGSMANSAPGIIQTPRITGTGTLEVTQGPGVTYEMWSAIIPNAADRDREDDPDADGFTNLEEFLFGTSPVSGTGTLTPIEATPSGLIIRWNQRVSGASVYVLQESTTLLDNPWPTSAATITNDAVQDVPDYVRKQALIPLTGAKKFVRVEATE